MFGPALTPPPLSTEQSQSIKIAITKSGEKGNSVPNKGHRLIEMSAITQTHWLRDSRGITNTAPHSVTSSILKS